MKALNGIIRILPSIPKTAKEKQGNARYADAWSGDNVIFLCH